MAMITIQNLACVLTCLSFEYWARVLTCLSLIQNERLWKQVLSVDMTLDINLNAYVFFMNFISAVCTINVM